MGKLFFIICLLSVCLISCDPSEDMDALILNRTDHDLKVHFVSSITASEIKEIKAMSSIYYIEGNGNNALGGITFTLAQYDSIYIGDKNQNILKVYKEDTKGKNIYDIDTYWNRSKPSRNFVQYTFEITDEDIGQ